MHFFKAGRFLLIGIFILISHSENFAQINTPDSVLGKKKHDEGFEAYYEDDWEKLREAFTEGVPLLEKSGPWPQYISMCRGLNRYYNNNENYDFDSITKYSEKVLYTLNNHIKAKDGSYYWPLFDIGSFKLRQGAYNQAIKIFEEVHTLFEQDTSLGKDDYAMVYQSLGICYREKGDYDEAMRYYQQALEFMNPQDYEEVADILNSIAKLQTELGNRDKAINMYQKAIKLLDPQEYRYILTDYYYSLAEIYNETGQNNRVQYCLDKAQELGKLKNISDKMAHYDILSQFYARQSNYEEAFKAQEKYEDAIGEYFKKRPRHPAVVEAYLKRAEILAQKGQVNQALEICQKNIMLLTKDWQYEEIKENPLPETVTQPIFVIPNLRKKASYFKKLFDQTGSIEHLQNSLDTYRITLKLISRLRNEFRSSESTLLLAQISSPALEEAMLTCFELFQLTQDKTYTEYALEIMEYNKAALLHANLQEALAKGSSGIPEEIKAEESIISSRIEDLQRIVFAIESKDALTEKELARLKRQKAVLFQEENRRNEFMAKLEKDFPDYFNKKYENSLVTVTDLQAKLEYEDVLVEYFWGENFTYVLAVGAQEIAFHQIEMEQETKNRIRSYRQMLKERDQVLKEGFSVEYFTQFCEHSFSIYQDLLEEVLTKFQKKKRLIIVADGLMSYLPFEVLLEQTAPKSIVNYSHLPYLLKSYAINYAYSATLFEKSSLDKKAKQTGTALSIAPTYKDATNWDVELVNSLRSENTRSGFAPLKHNRKEAEIVRNIWGGKALLGPDASEKGFKSLASDYQIIHMAMHAYANDENPMFSGLVFKGLKSLQNVGEEGEGILYTQEIYNMDLNADLVVLSGCHTGAGQLREGEGVLSLARAFAFAGVPSTAMSLWQADDESISTIMTSFHEYLKEGYTKSSAMRQAKLDFLESSDRTHPYFWAAFMTIGDDSPLVESKLNLWSLGLLVLALLILGITLQAIRQKS